jgi:hypothetical protein
MLLGQGLGLGVNILENTFIYFLGGLFLYQASVYKNFENGHSER